MKHKCFIVSFCLTIGLCLSSLMAENVHIIGDWTTPGIVNGDLVVVNGSINIPGGDLFVHGDVKVTSGRVLMQNGHLKIDGDLLVTNTYDFPMGDATVDVTGDLEVAGAITTNSYNGDAYIEVQEQNEGVAGNLYAGRITTNAPNFAYVLADHFIEVPGSIVTRSWSGQSGHAYVRSIGMAEPYGDIYAGSISTFSDGLFAYVEAENGHVTVNGDISTRGSGYAYVRAEGNITAGSIHTWAYWNPSTNAAYAYVSGEKVDVVGDIRTYTQLSGDPIPGQMGYAHVEARPSVLPGQEGTFEDVIAQNISTMGNETSYVSARRSVEVRGDIFTWEGPPSEENGVVMGIAKQNGNGFVEGGSFVAAGGVEGVNLLLAPRSYKSTFVGSPGWIRANNVITDNRYEDASVRAAAGIDVSQDIHTYGDECALAYIYTNSNSIKAGNISTGNGLLGYVLSEQGDVIVKNVISTQTYPEGECLSPRFRQVPPLAFGGSFVVSGEGNIEAEKIFTDGVEDASVEAPQGMIDVKGPIVTRVYFNGNEAGVSALNDIRAGAISTVAFEDAGSANIESDSGSILVREDIRTVSVSGDAYVKATSGDIKARSIKTVTEFGDDSIQAGPGSGEFQLLIDEFDSDNALNIANSEFNLDRDYNWNTLLSLTGSCTLNGKGHKLILGPQGGFIVNGAGTLFLRNITICNIWGEVISCATDDGTIKCEDVTWTLSDDTLFDAGKIVLAGNLAINGPGNIFDYQSTQQSVIGEDSEWLFDRGVTFSYASDNMNNIAMIDATSVLRFDGAMMDAAEDIRLTRGTLAFDNFVRFLAVTDKTIYFGNNTGAGDIDLRFGEAAKMCWTGTLENENT